MAMHLCTALGGTLHSEGPIKCAGNDDTAIALLRCQDLSVLFLFFKRGDI